MKILFIGDVVGDNGIDILRKKLPNLKRKYNVDICAINAENSHSTGTGLNLSTAQELLSIGADILTGGNHSLRRCDISLYEENPYILCPANILVADETCGTYTIDMGKYQITFINLIGTAFLDANRNPFFEVDKLLKNIQTKYIIVDFHAESTAEKYALANYLDGRVTAVVGTHTHVQTNDATVLPKGTLYISDLGAVCAKESILGVETAIAVDKQHYLTPQKFKVAVGDGNIQGVLLDLEQKNIVIINE